VRQKVVGIAAAVSLSTHFALRCNGPKCDGASDQAGNAERPLSSRLGQRLARRHITTIRLKATSHANA